MKIYCSGIGGIGLSAYAFLQQKNGHTLLGSDRVESTMTAALSGEGIAVSCEQDGSHIPEDCDLFVYSEAIPQDAPERRKAAELGIRQCSYFQALGELSRDSRVIAVCGTHGKSSTTAMAAKVLMDAGQDPTVVVGTTSPDLGGQNWRKGGSDLFLLEACEYRRSFHHLSPDIILMTNADGDHFDAFASVEEYQQAFVDFLRLLPEGG
ncbi:MAG: Mur ligase domain-containing protein, partial [Candidatus Peribacteraceae bacterium]|nr:Mur ligase domain-containing protein [Candidatus Peribacteraceae bacterium]